MYWSWASSLLGFEIRVWGSGSMWYLDLAYVESKVLQIQSEKDSMIKNPLFNQLSPNEQYAEVSWLMSNCVSNSLRYDIHTEIRLSLCQAQTESGSEPGSEPAKVHD